MNDLPLPRAACWDREGANYVLQTEALANSGAAFLATHTPIEGFKVEGPASAAVVEQTEKGLLDALSNNDVRHAFAVVQGEPGSGKSHLIRWLAEMWPKGRDIPVLLRRAEASLEGSLRGLRDAIPPRYRHIVGNVEPKQVKALKGRIADFTSNLSNSLDPEYFEKAQADHDFCEEYLPGEILRSDDVRLGWQAPARIVKLMSGIGADGSSNTRNSESASFTVPEIADLAPYTTRVGKASLRAGRLLGHIGKELGAIEAVVREGLPPEVLLTTHRSKAPFAAKLTEALNARRNQAIQNSLGISSGKLKEIFQDLRRALKQDGKRLVILLEDITAWEGIDDGLIDVLIDDAKTAGDSLCDQVAVVGVTPYYLRHIKENYQQRVTLSVGLGDEKGDLQDVANLREPGMRARFVATYLLAIRAGADRIEVWRDKRMANASERVPNICDACPLDARERCHEAFGALDGVGLYPFSHRSIENFYSALKKQVQGMTWRTPRGVIQGVLVPTLTRPQALANAAYPVREIEVHEGIERDQSSVIGPARARLDASIDDLGKRERARRLIAFWGARDSNETSLLQNGDLSYASVPKSIFESFGVPWIGGEVATGGSHLDADLPDRSTARERAAEEAVAVAEAPADVGLDRDQDRTSTSAKRTAIPKAVAGEKAPTGDQAKAKHQDRPKPIPQKEVQAFMLEVEAFRRDGEFRNPKTWNDFARELLNRIDPRRLDIDEPQFKTIFKEDLIKVKGTSKVEQKRYFELPVESWLLDGLDAYAQMRHAEHFGAMSSIDQDVVRRQVARCLRRMEELARAHVDRWTASLQDGAPWSRIGTATQVLLVRAWLRGDVRPSAEPIEQWRAVLKGDGQVGTDPKSRVESWDAILRKTNDGHLAMRAHLVEAVRLGQGKGDSYGLADAAIPFAAIASLLKEFRLAERPKASTAIPPDSVQMKVWEAGEATADRLGRLPGDEYDRLRNRLANIDRTCRGYGIADHIRRVESAVTRAEAGLPPASKQPSATAWLRQKETLIKSASAGDRLADVERAMVAILDQAKPDRRLQTLDLVAGRPAAAIEEVERVVGEAEKVVAIVKTATADFVGTTHAGAYSIGDVQSRGRLLATQVQEAMSVWSIDA